MASPTMCAMLAACAERKINFERASEGCTSKFQRKYDEQSPKSLIRFYSSDMHFDATMDNTYIINFGNNIQSSYKKTNKSMGAGPSYTELNICAIQSV
jgi:hypothetical protein